MNVTSDSHSSAFIFSLVALLFYVVALAFAWSSAHPLARRARWPLVAMCLLTVLALAINMVSARIR